MSVKIAAGADESAAWTCVAETSIDLGAFCAQMHGATRSEKAAESAGPQRQRSLLLTASVVPFICLDDNWPVWLPPLSQTVKSQFASPENTDPSVLREQRHAESVYHGCNQ